MQVSVPFILETVREVQCIGITFCRQISNHSEFDHLHAYTLEKMLLAPLLSSYGLKNSNSRKSMPIIQYHQQDYLQPIARSLLSAIVKNLI